MRPSSIAAIALRCEPSDQSSISWRVTPADRAVFSPTVTIMFMFGASGRSACEGESHCCMPAHGYGDFMKLTGDWVICAAPPATATRFMPAMISAAATVSADIPVAH